MNPWTLSVAALATLTALSLPLSVRAAAPLSLQAALELAVQRSEAARAGRAGQASAAEMAHAAGRLPDPTLELALENLPVTGADRLSTTRDSMTMKRIGLRQEWVSRDKRAARTAAAAATEAQMAVQAAAAVAETRLQTALAYADAYYAGEALTLAALMVHHVHEEWRVAQARLASAAGDSQELLAQSVARGTAEDDSAEAQQSQNTALLTLQRWTGLAADGPLLPPELPPELPRGSSSTLPPASPPASESGHAQLTHDAAPHAPPDAPSPPEEAAYVAAHPSVLASARAADAARRSAAVTASERDPNWSWGVSYGQRAGYSDMVSFGVSVPIPLAPHERQDRETGAKLAQAVAAESDLREATRAAGAEYRALASDVQRLQDRITHYRADVLAPATQRIAVATAAYAANGATLGTLFDARRAEVDAERKLLALQRDLTRARLRLRYTPLSLGDVGGAS